MEPNLVFFLTLDTSSVDFEMFSMDPLPPLSFLLGMYMGILVSLAKAFRFFPSVGVTGGDGILEAEDI